jgi:hypothetical protein
MRVELVPAYDSDIDQVMLQGPPSGPAGEAPLAPVVGLDMAFDRADGRLIRVVIEREGAAVKDHVMARHVLRRLFGDAAMTRLVGMADGGEAAGPCAPDPALAGVLSRMARLGAARISSPVPPWSPLWAAEAALVAQRGGLAEVAIRHAAEAVVGLAYAADAGSMPDALRETALAVAALAERVEPEAAMRLRTAVGPPPANPWPSDELQIQDGNGIPSRLPRPGEPCLPAGQGPADLQWSLDYDRVPPGLFLPAISPCLDMTLRAGDRPGVVIVEVPLRPEADRCALSRCRVRLVEPATRQIIAQRELTAVNGRAQAQLPVPSRRSGLWIEVVDDEHRPVNSERTRRIRSALRWADAALRAEQRPHALALGRAGETWAALAVRSWRQCESEWERAGDVDRAALASVRLASIDLGSLHRQPTSAWAAALADQPPLRDPAFLAEAAAVPGPECPRRR